MIKKVVISIVVLVCLLGCGIYYILYSRSFLELVVRKSIAARMPDATVETFQYEGRQFKFSGQLTLEKVKLRLKLPDQSQEYSWQKLVLTNLSGWFDPAKKIRVHWDGMDAKVGDFETQGLNLDLNIGMLNNQIDKMTGQLDAPGVKYDEYAVKNVTSALVGDSRQIHFNDITADGYEGKLSGQILLDYAPAISYSIQLAVLGLDLKALESSNPQVFSQVDGKINGHVQISGDVKIVTQLQSDLDIPDGGTVKAAWLKFIVDYVPQSTQKRDLELLIKNNGNIPVEQAKIALRSLDQNRLTSLVTLKSAKINMDINLTMDINVEGGLSELFKYRSVLAQ